MPKKLVRPERIERAIVMLRGQRVMLDQDLAELYCVDVKVLNQAVKRNKERFPADFMFRLTWREVGRSRSQIVTLNTQASNITDEMGNGQVAARGGNVKHRPYAFTEQGVAMLSSVLRSPRAVRVNIEIMRAFVKLRELLQSNAELARRLDELERKYDGQFRVVFDAIRELMSPRQEPSRRIGFGAAADETEQGDSEEATLV